MAFVVKIELESVSDDYIRIEFFKELIKKFLEGVNII